MWIIAAWEGTLQEVCVRGFGRCCIYSEMGGTEGDGSERMGTLGVSVGKMKALAVKRETETLIGKDRQNVTCFVY
jgi:hypothetical protein